MSLTKLINSGLLCPYCGKKTEYIDSKEIYNQNFGLMYICRPCDAYVGTYSNDPTIALGRVAKKDLREARKEAHKYFDNLWQQRVASQEVSEKEARDAAYSWLSKKMLKPREQAHIGMLNKSECKKVVDLCKPYYKNLG